MKYAVVKIGGSQYKIKEGDEIEVDRLTVDEGEIELENVLLLRDEDKITIGQPTIADIKIKAKILSHLKGDKIRVSRFKAKSRYRKVKGFRPSLTKIKIEGFVNAKAQKVATTKTQKTAKPKTMTSKKASK
ncbi:MAG: 50S ribosomal protein L21 [bacterium]|nr:50S ribosomal protein L21 [bacterium]